MRLSEREWAENQLRSAAVLRPQFHEDLPGYPARKSGEEWQPVAKRRKEPSWFPKAPPGRAGLFTIHNIALHRSLTDIRGIRPQSDWHRQIARPHGYGAGHAAGTEERDQKWAVLPNDRSEVCHELYLFQRNLVSCRGILRACFKVFCPQRLGGR